MPCRLQHPQQANRPQLIADMAVTPEPGTTPATLAQPQLDGMDDHVLLSDDEELGTPAQAAGASTALPMTGLTMPASQVSAVVANVAETAVFCSKDACMPGYKMDNPFQSAFSTAIKCPSRGTMQI